MLDPGNGKSLERSGHARAMPQDQSLRITQRPCNMTHHMSSPGLLMERALGESRQSNRGDACGNAAAQTVRFSRLGIAGWVTPAVLLAKHGRSSRGQPTPAGSVPWSIDAVGGYLDSEPARCLREPTTFADPDLSGIRNRTLGRNAYRARAHGIGRT